jgi:hypothetical protein
VSTTYHEGRLDHPVIVAHRNWPEIKLFCLLAVGAI